MSVKYITAAEADRMRRTFATLFVPNADLLGQSGVLGHLRTDYYIVHDDDPRLQSPDPVCDTKRTK